MARPKPDMQTVEHESSPYKYFTMMLNMAEDDLNPHEYRLLAHYVRWAGHGKKHQESVRQIAKVTRMGKSTIDKTREKLEAKGYIKVTKPTEEERKEGVATQVLVLDRWAENINRYAKGVPNQVHGVDPDKDTGVPNQVQGGVPKQVDSEERGTEEPFEKQNTPLPQSSDSHEPPKDAFAGFVETLPIDDEPPPTAKPPISDDMAAKLLINAYLTSNRSADVKMLDNRDRKREAMILYEEGMRPFHIQTYLKRLKAEEFWAGKNVSWKYLIGNIVSHFEARPAVTVVYEPETPLPQLDLTGEPDPTFTEAAFDKMLEDAAKAMAYQG